MNKLKTCILLFLSLILFSGGCKKEDSNDQNSNTAHKYDCINGNCQSRSGGPYATLGDCIGSCGDSDDLYYDCINGDCVSRLNGKYSSLRVCQNTCEGSPEDSSSNNTTFTDPRDGKTYRIVQIGNQYWFAENLRYSASILRIESKGVWASNGTGYPDGTPGWCYYNNDRANDSKYGKLYNWNAVNTGSLCPPGWHIPTNNEWRTLISYLGGKDVAGGKMKSTTGWSPPNTAATNQSGFSGLPGGYRDKDGEFYRVGTGGYWWSSTENDLNSAWKRSLNNNMGSVDELYFFMKNSGLSCRCVKN